MHLSLLCRIQQDKEHRPCSGTCDCHPDDPFRCECECHQPVRMEQDPTYRKVYEL